jgi:thioredoxin-like negative regulator of GroEL
VQPQKVTEAELHVALESRDVPIIIDFYATW